MHPLVAELRQRYPQASAAEPDDDAFVDGVEAFLKERQSRTLGASLHARPTPPPTATSASVDITAAGARGVPRETPARPILTRAEAGDAAKGLVRGAVSMAGAPVRLAVKGYKETHGLPVELGTPQDIEDMATLAGMGAAAVPGIGGPLAGVVRAGIFGAAQKGTEGALTGKPAGTVLDEAMTAGLVTAPLGALDMVRGMPVARRGARAAVSAGERFVDPVTQHARTAAAGVRAQAEAMVTKAEAMMPSVQQRFTATVAEKAIRVAQQMDAIATKAEAGETLAPEEVRAVQRVRARKAVAREAAQETVGDVVGAPPAPLAVERSGEPAPGPTAAGMETEGPRPPATRAPEPPAPDPTHGELFRQSRDAQSAAEEGIHTLRAVRSEKKADLGQRAIRIAGKRYLIPRGVSVTRQIISDIETAAQDAVQFTEQARAARDAAGVRVATPRPKARGQFASKQARALFDMLPDAEKQYFPAGAPLTSATIKEHIAYRLDDMERAPEWAQIPAAHQVHLREAADGHMRAVYSGYARSTPYALRRTQRMPADRAPAPTSATRWLHSTGGRLRAIAPEIMRRVDTADDTATIRAGRSTREWTDSGIARLTPRERIEVGLAQEGFRDPSTLSPAQQAALGTMKRQRAMFERMARAVGFEHFRGEDYMHHIIPEPSQLKVPRLGKNAMRERILEAAVERKDFPDRSTAEAAIEQYIALKDKGVVAGADQLARSLAEKNPGMTFAEAMGMITRMSEGGREHGFGGFQGRSANLPFYDPDPLHAWSHYIARAHKTIAEREQFGALREGADGPHVVGLARVDALLGRIRNADRRAEAARLFRDIRGGVQQDPAMRGPLAKLRTTGTFLLSPLSSITNRSQIVNNLMAGDTETFLRGTARGRTAAGRRLAEDAGVRLDAHFENELSVLSAQGGLPRWWVKVIGFQRAERANRTEAANVGDLYAQKRARQLHAGQNAETAARELERLGLDAEDVRAQKGVLTYDQRLLAAKRFTDRTQFANRNQDLWAGARSSEWGKTFAQYKTFSYQQTRFLHDEIVEGFKDPARRARAARTVILLASVYPLTGEATEDLRALLGGRERQTTGLARYLEDIAAVGGLGILGDVMQSMRYSSLPGFLLGPAIGRPVDMATSGYKMVTDDTLAKRRAAEKKLQRDLLRTLPGVGPFIAPRLVPYPSRRKTAS